MSDDVFEILLLSDGRETIVDKDIYPQLRKFEWHAMRHRDGDYYAVRKYTDEAGRRQSILMHREICGCAKGDGNEVDHINKNKLDNRRSNLRKCSRAQNARNRDKQANNSSGYKGVTWDPVNELWISRVIERVNGKQKSHFLGRFSCKHAAAEAYNKAAQVLHGEFVRLNTIIKE
jgi:hypothetical protein